MTASTNHFPMSPAGLPEAKAPDLVDLADSDQIDLRIAPVSKRIGDSTVRMLAYNGSVPGPTLRVRQGSSLTVNVENEGDLDATVHWHGLRLDNRYDGTTLTQAPMPIGGGFAYRLEFPDAGVYWYHPHIREDYGQEMGLYGNIVVVPAEEDYWPPANREVTITLDDVLIEDGRIAPFDRETSTYTAMGRFGNVLLVNGEQEQSLTARQGEVVRFYFTNTANTRVFNLGMRGARMKLVGGDSGHYEREQFVDRVLIAPSERVVVDVLFAEAGEARLEHRTPNRTYAVASISVVDARVERSLEKEFGVLRTNADMAAAREQVARFLDAEPDKTLALVATMDMGRPEIAAGETLAYACPMHPEILSHEPGKCPKCGMKLLAAAAPVQGQESEMRYAGHGQGENQEHQHSNEGGEHAHEPSGIEWEDDMVDVNRLTNPSNTRWKLVDRATGAEGADIDWRFRVGDRVKIRLVNEMDSDHPMHHPFHIHGAGRFLILSRDGVVEPNLVWKDTVLIPTGQTVDILLDVTNAGVWMAHCHIAEHHESGMMLKFSVEP